MEGILTISAYLLIGVFTAELLTDADVGYGEWIFIALVHPLLVMMMLVMITIRAMLWFVELIITKRGKK